MIVFVPASDRRIGGIALSCPTKKEIQKKSIDDVVGVMPSAIFVQPSWIAVVYKIPRRKLRA
jgi:hypothetical protein